MKDRKLTKKLGALLLATMYLVSMLFYGMTLTTTVKAELYSQKNPEIIITNVCNTSPSVSIRNAVGTKVNKAVFECVVLYNNSNKTLDFGDYKLRVNDSDPYSLAIEGEHLVAPRDYLIVWLKGNAFYDLDVQPDISIFKQAWGITNLPDSKIACVEKYHTNLRDKKSDSVTWFKLEVVTDNGLPICEATVDLTKKTSSNVYSAFCFKLASKNTRKLKFDKYIAKKFKPGTKTWDYSNTKSSNAEYRAVLPNVDAPKIDNLAYPTSIENGENINISANITHQNTIYSAKVFFSTDNVNFKEIAMTNTEWKYATNVKAARHTAVININDIYGAGQVNFYLTFTDGVNRVRFPQDGVLAVNVNKQMPEKINITDGQYFSDTEFIKILPSDINASKDLRIDGVSKKVFATIANEPIFAVRTDSLSNYFVNKVKSNGTFISELAYDSWREQEYSFLLDSSTFNDEGEYKTVSVEAGIKTDDDMSGDFDPKEAEFDDFNVRNVRLMFADGTSIYPKFATENFEYGAKQITLPYSPKAYYLGNCSNTGANPYALSTDFKFEIPADKYDAIGYICNTQKLDNGYHNIEYYENGKLIYSRKVYVDNTNPYIKTNVNDGQTFDSFEDIKLEVIDNQSGIEEYSIKLDEKSVTMPISLNKIQLQPGAHTLNVRAIDKANNEISKKLTFYIDDEKCKFEPNEQQEILDNKNVFKVTNFKENSKITFHKAKEIFASQSNTEFTDGENKWSILQDDNAFDNIKMNELSSENEGLIKDDDSSVILTKNNVGIPYQLYTISLDSDVKDSDSLVLNWRGYTNEHNSVSIYVYNNVKKVWDLVGKGNGMNTFDIQSELSSGEHISNGKIKVAVEGGILDNTRDNVKYNVIEQRSSNSFTLGWMTDTQHLSEKNPAVYNAITEYLAGKYNNGEIQYAIHSGDIVNSASVDSWWQNATNAMKKLDDAGMPYGVLAGNHDVNFSDTDITNYSKYFGAHKYQDKVWYGESFNDNFMHYDLISPNGHDLIVVYISYKPTLTTEMQNWLNDKISRFSDRDCIIVCHEYMGEEPIEKTATAKSLLKNVIAKNKNVRLVLNGHHEGDTHYQQTNITYTDGTKGVLNEMFFNFQFNEKDNDGYVRLLTFDGNYMHFKTYSTVKGTYLEDSENQNSIPLALKSGVRSVATDSLSIQIINNELQQVTHDVENKDNYSLINATYSDDIISEFSQRAGVLSGIVAKVVSPKGFSSYSQVVTVVADRKPIISLPSYQVIEHGTAFDSKAGVSCIDFEDGDLSDKVNVIQSINTNNLGYQQVQYVVKDSSGNQTTYIRRVVVVDTVAPRFVSIEPVRVGNSNLDTISNGIIAHDSCDGDVSASVKVVTSFISSMPGEYLIEFSAKDKSLNEAKAYRRVNIFDNTKPKISGSATKSVNVKAKVNLKKGYTASDDVDGNITSKIKVSGKVKVKKLGIYNIKYSVTDEAGNKTQKTVKYIVVDKVKPKIVTPKKFKFVAKKRTNLLKGVKWTDNYYKGGRKGIKVYVNNVLVKKPAKYVFKKATKYKVKYQVTDKSKNTGFKTVIVKVAKK